PPVPPPPPGQPPVPPPPPPGYGAGGGMPGGPAQPSNNGLAIASLVVSIVGLICCNFLIVSIVGVVLGFIAKNQIAKTGQRGGGMAMAGIIIGIVGIVIGIVLLILTFTSNSNYYWYSSN
ncbi:MAG: DUF4190 domain-containing protein, partial [Candidatus Nanopelagicales bacterium]